MQGLQERIGVENAPANGDASSPNSAANFQHRLEEAAQVTRRLAHDYGNILTGVLGFTELALSQVPTDSPSFRYLREAHRSAQQGAELTHLLQLFGCRKATQTQPASLPIVAAEEANRLRSTVGPGVEVQWNIPSDVPAVAISEDVLRTLLAQVLDNAREALPDRGTIALSAWVAQLTTSECKDLLGKPLPGPCIEVRVADTGTGLCDEARSNLFVRPFFSTKPRHRGIGLAVVYGILTSHQGGFRIESVAKRGTVVNLYLPVAAVPAPASPLPIPGASGEEKVLIIDDDPSVSQLVAVTLQSAGYRVQSAFSAEQALKIYAEAAPEPFHLVLSDVLMPGTNGFDLACRLRTQDANANFLFMSGHVSTELAQKHGVTWKFDLLFKPFRPETLLRSVRAALDRCNSRVQDGNGGCREGIGF